MLSPKDLKNLQEKSAEIIKDVGKLTRDSFERINIYKYKDSRDLITKTDLEAEDRLKENLHMIFPSAGFILEERENNLASEYNWVIDPIDQTKNFALKLPMFFSHIALLENDIPVLGNIYQPISDQLFSASNNNGAFLNGESIVIETTRTIDNAVVDLDLANINDFTIKKGLISKIIPLTYRLRLSGGAFLIYLATGAIDGYIGIYKKHKIYDLAPRIVILKETGLETYYESTNEIMYFVAGNKNIFPVLKNVLEESKKYLVK